MFFAVYNYPKSPVGEVEDIVPCSSVCTSVRMCVCNNFAALQLGIRAVVCVHYSVLMDIMLVDNWLSLTSCLVAYAVLSSCNSCWDFGCGYLMVS